MSTNNKALVAVGQGKLIINSETNITLNKNMNTSSSSRGGGIYVDGGILELNEGRITENFAFIAGGGIYVENKGSVIIHGGIISENITQTGDISCRGGGGIYITGNSTASMNGGTILKNQCVHYTGSILIPYGNGGGIFIENGSSFTKRATSGNSSGIIYGGTGDTANTCTNNGGYAIYRSFGSKNSRNTTLGGYDEISTNSDEGWE